jgi:translocation and assembly module TamB
MHTMGLFKRTATVAAPVPANRSSPPALGKWKRRLLAVVGLLVVLLVLAPILVAHTPLRNWLIARALPQLQGNVRIGGASLGWFRRPILTDIEVRDGEGRRLLHVPRLEGGKTLIALLCQPFDLGDFRLTQPAVHVVCSGDSSNLETVLAYWLNKKESPPDEGIPLKGIAVHVEITEASLTLEDEDTGRKWSLDPLALSISVPRDRRTPAQFHLNASVAEPNRKGNLRVEVSAHLVETNGQKPRFRAEGAVRAENAPLETIEPFLRRIEPHLKLSGLARADLKLRASDGQPGAPDLRLEGSLALQELAVSDALLSPDVLRLQRVDAACRIALDSSRVRIEQLEFRSEVGKVSLAGTIDVAKDLREAFLQPGHRVEAELNLARLANLVPNALHLTKDTLLESGTLSLQLRSSLRDHSLLWEGDLHTSDLEGLYQGQRLIWKEPFAVVFAARQEASAPLPVFERFRVDSDFLRLEISGSLEEWTAQGSFNLGRLSDHLAGFVELGSSRVQGEGSLRASSRRHPRGGHRLESDLRLAQLALIDGAQAWRENNISIRIDLIADRLGGRRIQAGALHVLAGQDGIDLDLLEPIADWSALRSVRARLRVHGDLSRWHGRISRMTGALAGVEMGGQIEVDGRLRYETEMMQLEDVKVTGHAVRFRGWGTCLDESSLDFTTCGRWLPARETLELQHTRLSCPTLTAQAPAVTVRIDRAGAWLITAGATLQGDVARLLGSGFQTWRAGGVSPLLRENQGANAPRSPLQLGGALAGRLDLRPDEGRQVVQFDGNVQNLVFGSPAALAWRESRVNLTGHVVYDLLKDSLQIVQLHADSLSLNCDATGEVRALSSDMELSLQGKLVYDLEKLDAQLRPYLGPGVKLTGRDVRPFRIAGALSGSATPLLGRLRGEAGLNWQELQALGCQVGAAELRGVLGNGWFRAAPIDAAFNRGRLRLEPALRLDPLPLEVTLPKGRAIDHARLTPAACASAVGYALPALANVAQADGDISLDLQSGRVPLTDPAKADVVGWLTIHSAQVSGGPLVQELSVLLQGPPALTLAKDNVVPFRLVDGRVYHTGLELHFPELTIRTSGSVGLDGSLSLTAEMPVPPKWLGNNKLAKAAFGNQVIRLPIGGTLSKPKIDEQALRTAAQRFVQQAAENALRQEMDGKIKKEAENGLRKLFRSRK